MRPWLLVSLPLLFLASVAFGAGGEPEQIMSRSANAAHDFESLLATAAMVGPVGINPFLGLGGLGIAAWTGAWSPPATIAFVGHPAFWITALLLGALMKFGHSSKLTKPIAEALGTGESLIGVAVVGVAGLAMLQEAGVVPVEQASMILASLLLVVAGSTAALIVIVRTAFDILVWLSPFPFVDLLFEVLKFAVTVVLLAMAVFAPGAAVVINLLLVVAAAFTVRWALRTTAFGLTVTGDLAFGWMRQERELPRQADGGLGPFRAFVVEFEGLSKRQRGDLTFGSEWRLTTRGMFSGEQIRSLGANVEISRGLLGVTLAGSGGRVLLPPRYKHLFDELARESGAKVVEDAGATPMPASAPS